MIPLGPFSLVEVIGHGGMGEVWLARHTATGTPVAVKVLTVAAAKNDFFVAAFLNEARATASLEHRNIAAIYDYGRIDADTEAASQGQLAAASPYLVMELARGVSLEPLLGRLPWAELYALLRCLLDALAHAHARGVIHRDLKPGNALLAGDRRALKLTDFGLAFPAELAAEPRLPRPEEGLVGTPSYMAPEQVQGAWRDFGPWTDLYGLGCLATALLTGQPPFGRDLATQRALASQLLLPTPALPEGADAPAGVGDSLGTLLEKEPARRFQRASDALWALDRLSGGADRAAARSPSPLDAPEAGFIRGGGATARAPGRVPPPPDSWRRSTPAAPQLPGVGLGLHGLRALPLVGRDAERDALWAALVATARSGVARAVLLSGAAGMGKSRMAEWLSVSAHELGAATPLRASWSPTPGAGDGLIPLVARALRCGGLPREALRARLDAALAAQPFPLGDREDERTALLELLSPSADPPGSSARFQSQEERVAVVRRLLSRMSADRPVVLWLEDLQWGAEGVALAEQLLEVQVFAPAPVLLLLTVGEDNLPGHEAEAERIRRLQARAEVQHLPLGPLSAPAQSRLLREVLGLERVLAARVAAWAAGCPLFAVQLVGDWVQRGLLVPGEGGFRLKRGARIQLPADLHQVWRRRVERVLAARPAATRDALMLAAVLGRDVDGAEWAAANAAGGWETPWDAVEELLAQRMARCESAGPREGWSFVNDLLRESLLRQARESGRWAGLNHLAAEMLSARGGAGGAETAERLGRHRVEAGEPEAALGPMLVAASARFEGGEFDRCLRLLARRERALNQAEVEPSDPRWGAGWGLEARALLELEQPDRAAAAVDRLERAASRYRWTQARAVSLWARSQIAARGGQIPEAVALLEDARRWARAAGDSALVAAARRDQGGVLLGQGLVEEAAICFSRARLAFAGLGDPIGLGRCLMGLGLCADRDGDQVQAAALLEEARQAFAASGSRWRVAEALTLQGELARQRGELAEAEARYREALALYQGLAARSAWLLQANLGLLLVARGRVGEAQGVLLSCLEHFERHGRTSIRGALHACLLPCFAATGAWDTLALHLAEAEGLLAETGLVERDIATSCERAGALAAAAGQRTLATRLWGLSLRQWTALSRPEAAAAVQAALAALRVASGGG